MHRAGNDEHRHGIDEAVDPAGLRPEESPGKERQHRDGDDRHDEVAGDLVGHPLHRRPGTLSLRDHLDDAREHGLRADFLGLHHKCAVGVQRCADKLVANPLGHGQWLPSQHGLVDGAAAFDHHAVHGHLLSGAHAHLVAHMHMTDGHVFLGAVRADAARCLGARPSSDLMAAEVCDRALSSRI